MRMRTAGHIRLCKYGRDLLTRDPVTVTSTLLPVLKGSAPGAREGGGHSASDSGREHSCSPVQHLLPS